MSHRTATVLIFSAMISGAPKMELGAIDDPLIKNYFKGPLQIDLKNVKAGDEAKAEVVADYFKIPVSTVLELKKTEDSWSEVLYTLAIAKRADRTPSSIVAHRQTQMEWSQIAQKYGLNIEDVDEDVRKVKQKLESLGLGIVR